MEKIVDGLRLVLVRGSITEQETDVIVNAANTGMRGGGGVDGAIHAAAGREMMEELKRVAPNGARTSEVVVTEGYRLLAKRVLHVAGPIWHGGDRSEADALAACYRNAIETAEQLGLTSISFPSISTGIYGYPIDRAAPIALGEALRAAKRGTSLEEIRFVTFSGEDDDAYAPLFERFDETHPSRAEREDAGVIS